MERKHLLTGQKKKKKKTEKKRERKGTKNWSRAENSGLPMPSLRGQSLFSAKSNQIKAKVLEHY